MSERTDFELSRIYAKGWTAGRSAEIDVTVEDLDAAVAELNPYEMPEERERWSAGFRDALRRAEERRGTAFK